MQKKLFVMLVFISLVVNACGAGRQVSVVDPRPETSYTVFTVDDVAFSNKKLYSFVQEWKGVPYRYAGLSKSGIDCSGLVFLLMQDVYDKEVPRKTSDLAVVAVKVDNMREGDVVFFDIDGKKYSHVGVYIENKKFLHASSTVGVTISCLSNPYFKRYFTFGARIP